MKTRITLVAAVVATCGVVLLVAQQQRAAGPYTAEQAADGRAAYQANCASCHASDMRGSEKGTRLLRSLTSLNDQHGELIGKAVAEHDPKLVLNQGDTVAVAEYIHSVLASTGGQCLALP